MRDADEALDVHEQEAKIDQGRDGVAPHIRATPFTTKSTITRPRDQFHRHQRDPSSWNLSYKPKDETLLVTLAYGIDEYFECNKNAEFYV